MSRLAQIGPLGGNISLQRRLILLFLPAMGILAIAINVGGNLLIDEYVQNAHDQILAGSALAIAEKTDLLDGHVEVDIPTVAFGMLRGAGMDNVYYAVTYRGALVTGYEGLLPAAGQTPPPGEIAYRDAVFRGQNVRVATLAKRLYGSNAPALVQVAQTVRAVTQAQRRLLIPFILAQVALIAVTGTIMFYGIRRGLAPITVLRREIESRAGFGLAGFEPLSAANMPRELLPLVTSFNVLLQRLQASFENNRRFSANASHQMRTPLAVIRTHLALLRRLDTDPEAESVVTEIEDGVIRLERLLTQLMTIARTEENSLSGGGEGQADLVEVATQTMADRVAMAFQKNLTLEFDNRAESGPIPVRGTDILLQQLIGNLLDNALLYTPDGGEVTMRIYDSGKVARLEIEDTGPGIAKEYRTLVFERFFRMPGSSTQSGSGLGLAIVRAICELIGAEVVLTDRINRPGLRAIVTFPIHRSKDGPPSASQRAPLYYPQPFWDLELRRRLE